MAPTQHQQPHFTPSGAAHGDTVPVTRRAAVGWALGFGGTLGLGLGGRIPTSPGPLALWAADRAGHRVFGLDGDGIVCCAVPVMAPIALRPCRKSGLWAVRSAVEARLDGPMEDLLFGVDARVVVRRPVPLGEPLGPSPKVSWAESAAPNRLWTVQSEGRLSQPLPFEPAATGGVQHLCRWVRRGRAWDRAFHLRLPFRTRAYAPSGDGVWVGDEGRCRLWFVTGQGVLAIDRSCRDADGIDAIAVAALGSGGGVWAAAGGAIVRLSQGGHRMPGQGGFLHIVDLCPSSS